MHIVRIKKCEDVKLGCCIKRKKKGTGIKQGTLFHWFKDKKSLARDFLALFLKMG